MIIFDGSLQRMDIGGIQRSYPGLMIKPSDRPGVRLVGDLLFAAAPMGLPLIEDTYRVQIDAADDFPITIPSVYELDGRVSKDFHAHPDGSLCLASRARLRLMLADGATLLTYINKLLIPYLYGYSYKERYGELPFGELDHGDDGILQDYASLFGVKSKAAALQMIRLAAMKKRDANKQECPCGSGRRVGKCHNRGVNRLRDRLSRTWFQGEYAQLTSFRRTAK